MFKIVGAHFTLTCFDSELSLFLGSVTWCHCDVLLSAVFFFLTNILLFQVWDGTNAKSTWLIICFFVQMIMHISSSPVLHSNWKNSKIIILERNPGDQSPERSVKLIRTTTSSSQWPLMTHLKNTSAHQICIYVCIDVNTRSPRFATSSNYSISWLLHHLPEIY